MFKWQKLYSSNKYAAAAARINKREDQIRRTTAIFAHEHQSALRLTVDFSNIYCEL
jgi:hypothetical protein